MTLEARGLRAERGGRILFCDLDLEVASGTVTVVVGPNGSGKTTLLRSLCGLFPVTGVVSLGGTELSALPHRERARRIAYLPQQTPATPGLTVHDAVMLGRLPHRTRLAGPGDSDRARVHESLERVGMQSFLARPLASLSGGERQRVMLARMLATEAGVMVFDEPTAALDVRHALDLLATLRDLANDGRAIVMALHDLPLADTHADQILCLRGDGTARIGPATEVLTPEYLDAVFGATFHRDSAGGLQLQLPRRRDG